MGAFERDKANHCRQDRFRMGSQQVDGSGLADKTKKKEKKRNSRKKMSVKM